MKYVRHHKKRSIAIVLIIGVLFFFLYPKQSIDIKTYKLRRQNIAQIVTTSGKVEAVTSAKLNFLTSGKLVYIGALRGDHVFAGQTIAAQDIRTVQRKLEEELRDYMKQRNTFDETRQSNQNRTPSQALNDTMKRVLQNNQYDLEKAVYSVELQSLAKEQSYLVSPIDGILTQADADTPGAIVASTAQYVVTDPRSLEFTLEVDEADIAKIKQDMSAQVVFESYPEKAVNLKINKIDFTSHLSSNGGNVFNVRAQLPDNSDYKYRIGMTGDSQIKLLEKHKVLTVPLGSIVEEKYVYVQNGAAFEKRKVKLGMRSDTDIEVISGLQDGDSIAISIDEVEAMHKNTKRFYFF